MPAGELGIGVYKTMVSLDIDEVQSVGVGNLLVMIGGINLVRDQEFSIADGIRMSVKMPLLPVPIMCIPAVFGQEMPPRFRPAFDEHMRGDIRHRISVIPLDVIRFVWIRTACPDTLPEVDQHDRSQAASLRKVAGAHTHQAMIAAGNGLRVHIDGRRVVGHAVEFLGSGSVGIHGPDGFADTSALVDVFPAVVHDPAVIENDRAEFADRALGELFDMGTVGIHPVQTRGHEGRRAAAENSVFATG